jgi:hypothetical protein
VAPTYGLNERGIEKREDVLDARCTSGNVFDAPEPVLLGIGEATSRDPTGLRDIKEGTVEHGVVESGLIGRRKSVVLCSEGCAEVGVGSSSASNGEVTRVSRGSRA